MAELTLIAGATAAAFTGCDGSGNTGANGKANCPAGSETCACYGNGTCNDGLICASKLCVSKGLGGATAQGGTSSAGEPGMGGSVPAQGGSLGSGGDVAMAGSAPASGGVVLGGAGQSPGGANATGAVASIAGMANGGKAIGGVGNGGVAGAATGGNPAVGGAVGAGGVLPSAGGTSNAGQTATGGTTAAQTCGNGLVEGSETCDTLPKNSDMGDGCTPTCMAEPSCPAAGGPCTSICGDGLVFDNEACDDGNVTAGDGCGAACAVEPNFTCTQAPLGDTMVVPLVVRDFKTGGDFELGPAASNGLNYANQGLLQTTLDAIGQKPVLASTTGTFNGAPGQNSLIASKLSFAQWYSETAPPSGNTYNATLATTLTLYRKPDGSAYVNRFGTRGDGLTSAQYLRTTSNYCGTIGKENHDAAGNAIPCTSCLVDSDPTTPQCESPDSTYCQTDPTYTGECVVNGSAWYGSFLQAAFDGNPLFFPADQLTPFSPSSTAQIAGNYQPGWPLEPGSALHNFSFTTEVRFWFKYDSTQIYQLSISGDDDIWMFVNKRLAVDMGGIHTPVLGDLTIANGVATARVIPTNVTSPTAITSTPNLGTLVHGGVYEVAIFHAERQTRSSSYQIGLAGFNTNRSVCQRQ